MVNPEYRAVLGVAAYSQNKREAGPCPTESLLSPIRTLTVGPGITPDLLSFEFAPKALAAFN